MVDNSTWTKQQFLLEFSEAMDMSYHEDFSVFAPQILYLVVED